MFTEVKLRLIQDSNNSYAYGNLSIEVGDDKVKIYIADNRTVEVDRAEFFRAIRILQAAEE